MRVMLIAPNFFDYPGQISEELRNMGHEVDWFDDRPGTNSFVKAVIRINKNLIHFIIKRYFTGIKEQIRQKQYDRVLLISGQSLSFTEDMLRELKELQTNAEFILYQWDSEKNFPYIKDVQYLFDKCYSFDRQDSCSNGRLTFLPLFYSRRYENIGKIPQKNYKYDLMFVGTAHPKKYKFVKEMSEKLSAIYKEQYIYFFYPSRFVYLYRKLRNPELKDARYNEFHFQAVGEKEMDALLMGSNCVLDSAQDGQTGLTIRVLETLGAKRKLITTNKDVVNYDFYRPENIYVYDGGFEFSSVFFQSDYVDIEQSVYEQYSLRNWLKVLLQEE